MSDPRFATWREYARTTTDGKSVRCGCCPKPATTAALMFINGHVWDVPMVACGKKCKAGMLSGWRHGQEKMPLPPQFKCRLEWIDILNVPPMEARS